MPEEVLDAVADAGRWRRILGGFPEPLRDVYFWPEYVALHRWETGSRALLYTYRRGDACWSYALLLQPIAPIGRGPGGDAQQWWDIETPYGYGGPLATTDDPDFL